MTSSGALSDALAATRRAELTRAARALLRRPVLRASGADAELVALVRRHAGTLREWFDRNTGWRLMVDSEVARLVKTVPDTGDATHPARDPRSVAEPARREATSRLLVELTGRDRGPLAALFAQALRLALQVDARGRHTRKHRVATELLALLLRREAGIRGKNEQEEEEDTPDDGSRRHDRETLPSRRGPRKRQTCAGCSVRTRLRPRRAG